MLNIFTFACEFRRICRVGELNLFCKQVLISSAFAYSSQWINKNQIAGSDRTRSGLKITESTNLTKTSQSIRDAAASSYTFSHAAVKLVPQRTTTLTKVKRVAWWCRATHQQNQHGHLWWVIKRDIFITIRYKNLISLQWDSEQCDSNYDYPAQARRRRRLQNGVPRTPAFATNTKSNCILCAIQIPYSIVELGRFFVVVNA